MCNGTASIPAPSLPAEISSSARQREAGSYNEAPSQRKVGDVRPRRAERGLARPSLKRRAASFAAASSLARCQAATAMTGASLPSPRLHASCRAASPATAPSTPGSTLRPCPPTLQRGGRGLWPCANRFCWASRAPAATSRRASLSHRRYGRWRLAAAALLLGRSLTLVAFTATLGRGGRPCLRAAGQHCVYSTSQGQAGPADRATHRRIPRSARRPPARPKGLQGRSPGELG